MRLGYRPKIDIECGYGIGHFADVGPQRALHVARAPAMIGGAEGLSKSIRTDRDHCREPAAFRPCANRS